jgi:hypothetical protein
MVMVQCWFTNDLLLISLAAHFGGSQSEAESAIQQHYISSMIQLLAAI